MNSKSLIEGKEYNIRYYDLDNFMQAYLEKERALINFVELYQEYKYSAQIIIPPKEVKQEYIMLIKVWRE